MKDKCSSLVSGHFNKHPFSIVHVLYFFELFCLARAEHGRLGLFGPLFDRIQLPE
jgi:hypothetical protein